MMSVALPAPPPFCERPFVHAACLPTSTTTAAAGEIINYTPNTTTPATVAPSSSYYRITVAPSYYRITVAPFLLPHYASAQ